MILYREGQLFRMPFLHIVLVVELGTFPNPEVSLIDASMSWVLDNFQTTILRLPYLEGYTFDN